MSINGPRGASCVVPDFPHKQTQVVAPQGRLIEHLVFHTAQGSFAGDPYIESDYGTVGGVVVEGSQRQHVGNDAVGVGGAGGRLRRLDSSQSLDGYVIGWNMD